MGTANNHTPVHAASDPDEDVAAAALYDTIHNRAFAEPLLLGEYPNGMGEGMPGPVAEDLKVISEPLDAYGVNYYNPTTVGAPGSPAVTAALRSAPQDDATMAVPEGIPFALVPVEAKEHTALGWPVAPEGLTELLVQLRDRYADALPPIHITESGCSTDNVLDGGCTSCGRCWTTSSGQRGTRSASGSSGRSSVMARCVRPRTATPGCASGSATPTDHRECRRSGSMRRRRPVSHKEPRAFGRAGIS